MLEDAADVGVLPGGPKPFHVVAEVSVCPKRDVGCDGACDGVDGGCAIVNECEESQEMVNEGHRNSGRPSR